MNKSTINFDDFQKLDLRVGKILEAFEVEESEKLIRMRVSFGELGERIIFAGIRKWYEPKDLEGKNFTFVFNLEPKKMMGEESQGMIIAAETGDGEVCVLITPDKDIPAGTKVC